MTTSLGLFAAGSRLETPNLCPEEASRRRSLLDKARLRLLGLMCDAELIL